jgi:SAM-dependent methyltransferase
MTDEREILRRVSEYYTRKLEEFGATPRGVDWNSSESQQVRFTQLLSVCEGDDSFRINDVGCGYGALVDRLGALPGCAEYTGYDVAPAMIEAARGRYRERAGVRFTTSAEDVPVAHYSVASGIFGVKGDAGAETWLAYVHRTLDWIRERSERGFAFNALTAYSDPSRMRPDLFYADPHALFEWCYRRYSRSVALLHDYGVWEFTIRVRLEAAADGSLQTVG